MQDLGVFLQNHWILSLALGAVLVLLVIVEFIKAKQTSSRLNPQNAVTLINHQNAIVVDIRNTEAFANGHIVGSISLPLRELEENSKKLEKFRQQPLIIVCATGQESARAALLLQKKGFQVQLLNGGLRAWQLASLPIIKD